MSGKISGLVWDSNLPKEEKYILLAYADHADHEGYGVRPSYALVAWKTQFTKRHVMRVVARLEEKGILVVDEQGGWSAANGNRANEWHIDIEKMPVRPPRKRDRRSDSQVTPVVTPRSPQTSIQPLSLSVGGDKLPSTGTFVKAKYYPVDCEKKIIYMKGYKKLQLTEFEEAWAKAGIIPMQGSRLNADPQYVEFARKPVPVKRHLLFDAIAECAWHFPAGFNSEALNNGKRKLGGAIGEMVKEFAEFLGKTSNETRDDEILAKRVRAAFAKWDEVKKKPNGESLTRPKNATDFFDWWNVWASTYEGKVAVDRNNPAYGLKITQ